MRRLPLLLLVLAAVAQAEHDPVPLDEPARLLAFGEADSGYGTPLTTVTPIAGGPPQLLVGAPTAAGGAGALYLVEAPEPGEAADGQGVFVAQGPGNALRFGRAVGAGDLNGDGFADLVVGATEHVGLGVFRGRVFLMWGTGEPDAPFTDPALFLAEDAALGSDLGGTVAVADLDQDGFDDFVVGDRARVPFAISSLLWIFYGAEDRGPVEPGEEVTPWRSAVIQANGQVLGAFVEARADWDCDGYPDLLTGGTGGGMQLLFNPTGTEDGPWEGPSTLAGVPRRVSFPEDVSGVTVSARNVGDLLDEGDAGCEDVLLGLPRAGEGAGDLVLLPGRRPNRWQPYSTPEAEAEKDFEELDTLRRRASRPGMHAMTSFAPVFTTQPEGERRKPDLLVGVPDAELDDFTGAEPGNLWWIPAEALFGPPDEPAPADNDGTGPADNPPLDSYASAVLEGNRVDMDLGRTVLLFSDLDDADEAPDFVVSTPGYRHTLDDGTSGAGGLWAIPSQPFGDGDGDGVAALLDCDDEDPGNFPGNPERCDGRDNDCSGGPDFDEAGEADADGDGTRSCEGDCDDADPAVHPEAVEACNGLDDDCDGRRDEEWDGDGDGWPDAAHADCAEAAEQGRVDCDDADPSIHPLAADGPDHLDRDCDGDPEWAGGCACGSAVPGSPSILLLLPLAAAARRRRTEPPCAAR